MSEEKQEWSITEEPEYIELSPRCNIEGLEGRTWARAGTFDDEPCDHCGCPSVQYARIDILNAKDTEIADLKQKLAEVGTERARLEVVVIELRRRLEETRKQLDKINTPELIDFKEAVILEAQHQRLRWGSQHDAGKEPQDWFWLIGYLAGKALRSHIDVDTQKALHHTITVAAACANWHAAILGITDMRPGIDPAAKGVEKTQ